MSRNQRGFTIIEALLILVIIGISGFTGWYVWHSKHNAEDELNSANQVASGTTPKVQSIKSYDDCTKAENTKIDTKAYPPTCTTSNSVVFRPTDPDNFSKQSEEINIPNNPNVTTDTRLAESGGYCYNTVVPGPQATAALQKLTEKYALVRVSPNCGDSFSITYQNVQGHWSVINSSHLGLCFHPEDSADINSSPTLQTAVKRLCD